MGANMITKATIDGILDVANFARNYIGGNVDRSGLGPRMTKWDGNTMSATESENAKGNAIITIEGAILGGITSSESAAAGSINYMKSGDRFAKFAAKAESQAGSLDVIGHGGPNIFEVNNITVDGGAKLINHRVLANLIKRNPQFTNKMNIRLLSCSTGEDQFAQNLANKLNTNVFAPNNILWAHPSGKLTVGATSSANTGKIIRFIPRKK
ncbi:hypothetical protein [uncultured Chryseobacterium sp.]|uniref:hypothetical protein n=1 Tax=uncultured Chryseobacterium sp. TaxID=259322 RepID=UPI0025E3071F|nr:hypothetical protein [uncultured Chryseobacterium sp.]